MKPTRADFVLRLLDYYRREVPYIIGARGTERHDAATGKVVPTPLVQTADGLRPAFALDCSGVGLTALHELGGPDVRWAYNTDALWKRPAKAPTSFVDLPPCGPGYELAAKPGDVALYRSASGLDPDDMQHATWLLSELPGGVWLVVSASNGSPTTTTLEVARTRKARVMVKASHLYRPGFAGFRSLDPFLS